MTCIWMLSKPKLFVCDTTIFQDHGAYKLQGFGHHVLRDHALLGGLPHPLQALPPSKKMAEGNDAVLPVLLGQAGHGITSTRLLLP